MSEEKIQTFLEGRPLTKNLQSLVYIATAGGCLAALSGLNIIKLTETVNYMNFGISITTLLMACLCSWMSWEIALHIQKEVDELVNRIVKLNRQVL